MLTAMSDEEPAAGRASHHACRDGPGCSARYTRARRRTRQRAARAGTGAASERTVIPGNSNRRGDVLRDVLLDRVASSQRRPPARDHLIPRIEEEAVDDEEEDGR